MADIPNQSYSITVTPVTDSWANGTLVVSSTGWTYQGQPVTDKHPNDDDVKFHVTLLHDGKPCELKFKDGRYHKKTNTIDGGRVKGKCLTGKGPGGDPEDSWTAQGEGSGETKAAGASNQ